MTLIANSQDINFTPGYWTYLLLVCWLSGCTFTACTAPDSSPRNANQKIWFTYPATYWNSQSLHLGNGHMGASFFGGTGQEVFALTEKSFWYGEPAQGNWEAAGINPRAKASLPVIRKAILNNNVATADSLITHHFFGSSENFGSFTSFGELKLHFGHDFDEVREYTRSLDLARALGEVRYAYQGTLYTREYFCSYPDQVLAMKLTADQPGKISFRLSADPIQDDFSITTGQQHFTIKGVIDGNERPFQLSVKIEQEGGSFQSLSNEVSVERADEVTLLVTLTTNYEMKYPDYMGSDASGRADQIIARASESGYDELKLRHIQDYQELFNRVQIDLNGPDSLTQWPTNKRFKRMRAGGSDPGYLELAFHLGRYLIISSSRPGTLPANLQGVWNAFRISPWSGNYQSNINLQEIYWSCGPTQLMECHEPYVDWIEDMAKSGREVAQRVYGTQGWVSHTTGNIWGHAAPIGDHPWGLYPVGAAWHAQHLWDHFAFTQDTSYLREQAYPLLKGASVFWLQNLQPYQGYLISVPTVSAEHGALETDQGLNPAFHDRRSDRYRYSLPGVYQDVQMIYDLFTNTSTAAEMVGEDAFSDSLLNVREKLLPPRQGQYGQLQEWYVDIDNPETHHRHIAHLYAVCPGTQFHPTTTPRWASAARKSLDMRGDGRYLEQELASGGNWSRAHRMWCWARLMDGDRAHKILTEMLTEQGFENVTTFQHAEYHWNREDFYMEDDMYLHFQVDGSASVPGVMAEMVMQSHLGEIQLLPALPEAWPDGHMSGLQARGGYLVDITWKNHELEKAVVNIPEGMEVPKLRLVKHEVDPLDDGRITLEYFESNP